MNLWIRGWQRGTAPLLKFMKNPDYYQQTRATHVVKRRYPAPLPSANRAPSLRRKHFVYESVEDNLPNPDGQPSFSVLLKDYVPDIGRPGEIVTVKENKARLLLLTKAAVYSSQENINTSGFVPRTESYSSRFAGTTVKLLSDFVLNISLNLEEPWTLEPWHIRSAFRKAHVHVPDHAFTMPKDTIIGPNMELEGKEFFITVTINKKEQVPVRCRIHHWSTKLEKRIPPVRDHWRFPSETIFSEDKEVAATLPEIIPPVLLPDGGPPFMRKTKLPTPSRKKHKGKGK